MSAGLGIPANFGAKSMNQTQLPQVYLQKNRDQSIHRKHPWVFSGAIARKDDGLRDGDLVSVCSHDGRILGFGHYHDGSIAVKLLHFGDSPYHDGFWFQKIGSAFKYRQMLLASGALPSDAWRWVHGEGDGLPGLIVDRYGDAVVIQCHTIGMHRQVEVISRAIRDCDPANIKLIFDKSRETLPKEYAAGTSNRFLLGDQTELTMTEHGIRYLVDPFQGQKTGFFLDQRDNRKLVQEFSRGRRVLNAFSYTGGFSLSALAGGAVSVDSVDVSSRALATLDQILDLNGMKDPPHKSIEADVPVWLKTCPQGAYDLMILDPPAFAKSLHKRHNAIQAYKRLNHEALKLMDRGGLLFTFSCSQVVTEELFYGTVVAAAIEAGRTVRLIRRLSQAPDHPVNLYHPEGHYLKGLLLQVED